MPGMELGCDGERGADGCVCGPADDAGSAAFFHGFHTANFVAAGVAAAGAVMALVLLPAQPTVSGDAAEPAPVGPPATVAAHG